MLLITPAYQKLQEDFHVQRPDYGTSAARHCDFIMHTADMLKTRDILDYGCGKALLQKGIPYPIQNYDPCMPEYSKRPLSAQIVVCTDVLEHIEPECLSAVLHDLLLLTKDLLFVNVATRPAGKFLPDGRNAHLIQEPANWWLQQLLPLFDLTSFQVLKGEFNAILVPPHLPAEDAT